MTQKLNENRNLSDQIYQDIRTRMIVGDLAPNDRLSIRKLAEEFQVSTMPVREALKRLEVEGALKGALKRAYSIPEISEQEARNLFFVRATLEGAGAELAMRFIRKPDLKKLRRYSLAMDSAWSKMNAREFLLQNFSFHSLIFQSSHNPDLTEIAEALYVRSGPWLARAIREVATKHDWANKHHEIVDAMEEGNARRVRQLIEEDVNWGANFFGEA